MVEQRTARLNLPIHETIWGDSVRPINPETEFEERLNRESYVVEVKRSLDPVPRGIRVRNENGSEWLEAVENFEDGMLLLC